MPLHFQIFTVQEFSRFLNFRFLVSEGSKNGSIAWKIDLTTCSFNVKSVELTVHSKVFENGKVIWQLIGDANKALLPMPGNDLQLHMYYASQISIFFFLRCDIEK